jgi:hypothetical protein
MMKLVRLLGLLLSLQGQTAAAVAAAYLAEGVVAVVEACLLPLVEVRPEEVEAAEGKVVVDCS